jgi:hypothetical protein
MFGLVFHHFRLAVKIPGEAIAFLSALGYRMSDPVFDQNQNVHLTMAAHPSQPAVEIIYPGKEGGPIDDLVQRQPQGIVYHLWYVTENLVSSLKQFKTAGHVCFLAETGATFSRPKGFLLPCDRHGADRSSRINPEAALTDVRIKDGRTGTDPAKSPLRFELSNLEPQRKSSCTKLNNQRLTPRWPTEARYRLVRLA